MLADCPAHVPAECSARGIRKGNFSPEKGERHWTSVYIAAAYYSRQLNLTQGTHIYSCSICCRRGVLIRLMLGSTAPQRLPFPSRFGLGTQ